MGKRVEWEPKESIYVSKVIDENDHSKGKKWVNQCFCSSPFPIPKLENIEHGHLSFQHITLLFKGNFLFHGANVNQWAHCWDGLTQVSEQTLLNWRGSEEFAEAAILNIRSE